MENSKHPTAVSQSVMENSVHSDSVGIEIKKKKKPGIIYLNYIPRYMTVKKVREYFLEFGEVKRLFLKPEKSQKAGKPSKFFKEGWVEFSRRKVAKRVAECLNGAQVGGKRHTPYYDALWSIKYLSKVQWSELNEGKAYKNARKEQRMKAEIAKVKREVNFYTQNIDIMKKNKKSQKTKLIDDHEQKGSKTLKASQPQVATSEKNKLSDDRNLLLLRKVFGGSVDE